MVSESYIISKNFVEDHFKKLQQKVFASWKHTNKEQNIIWIIFFLFRTLQIWNGLPKQKKKIHTNVKQILFVYLVTGS